MKYIYKTLVILLSQFIFFSSCDKPEPDYPHTVMDIDGNTYNTVLIGEQLWMKENLMTTRFSNGDPIPTTDPMNKSITLETVPIYQWFYFSDKPNSTIYGRFYTWFSVIDSRNVCPKGWHVPSSEDWNILINYLGGKEIAGGKLKETNQSYWVENNIGATNSSQFSAVPTSFRFSDGMKSLISRNDAHFWTNEESDFLYDGEKSFAKSFLIMGDHPDIYAQATEKKGGLTCRCIWDNKWH